jgi:DNA-binding HxlR family transcriptional regulator
MFAVKNLNASRQENRWVILVTYLLRDGRPRRFAEIQSQVRGISPHQLTHILHQLEMEGMIVHNVYSTMPPKVEYGLTVKGKEVLERFLEKGERAMQGEPT